jgi:hypothetical protein
LHSCRSAFSDDLGEADQQVGEDSNRTIGLGSLIFSDPLLYRCVTTASD